ncbi:purine-binding chemotaxis protein CheW [Natronoarchaeum philippinense]|uniref:Purine-binding chemotaxis protein CheW n=1 Tax=Natronoarchaeum philippinense TaxID=558529 RepID=A0A285P0N6_NATPI|nr:chemotaxis protein CheW [Natronoarchaeum philippinense]SNZ13441.1 purine-binding chemotaxis protein CheW [Natronoarchaeum philippinense]
MATELPDKLLELDDGGDADGRDPDPQEGEEETEERERFVVFRIGATRYAVGVEAVKSVVDAGEFTRVPRSSDAIEGVIDLRGDITAIIDPRVYLPDAGAGDSAADQRVLVFDRPSDRQGAGIRVDQVTGVESIPVSSIFRRPAPDEGVDASALAHELIRAVISREDEEDRISLLDVEGLVAVAGDT